MLLPSETPLAIAQSFVAGRHTDAKLVRGTPKAVDNALRRNGWRSITIDRGQYFTLCGLLAFSRGQGPNSTIIQWTVSENLSR